jgi:hypothetical protein
MFLRGLFALFICLSTIEASAGLFEIGVSGSYRRSNLDEVNFTETTSITGSYSWYFMEMSALEFSYTQGLSKVNTALQGGSINQKTQTEFTLIGVDFVLSLGGRQSSFRPYLKLGGVHVSRKILVSSDLFSPETIEPEDGIAPSAGIGVKLVLDKQLAIKLGVDAWTTPIGQDTPVEYDYAGRAGISWIF